MKIAAGFFRIGRNVSPGEVLQADRVRRDLGVAERPGHLLEVAQDRPHVVGKLDRPRHRIGALDDFPPVRADGSGVKTIVFGPAQSW